MNNSLESAEDYLERILMIKENKGFCRAIDIAREMNFSKASVSVALKKLKEKNQIVVDEEDGHISLTEEGYNIASEVYNRHKTLTKFFMSIGVDESTALEDACKVEHNLSKDTFEKLEKFVKNLK